jgi:hypothetical protein
VKSCAWLYLAGDAACYSMLYFMILRLFPAERTGMIIFFHLRLSASHLRVHVFLCISFLMIFTVCSMEQLGLEILITISSNHLTGVSDVFPCYACRFNDNSWGGKVKGGRDGKKRAILARRLPSFLMDFSACYAQWYQRCYCITKSNPCPTKFEKKKKKSTSRLTCGGEERKNARKGNPY